MRHEKRPLPTDSIWDRDLGFGFSLRLIIGIIVLLAWMAWAGLFS